jgi:hypothetical protein
VLLRDSLSWTVIESSLTLAMAAHFNVMKLKLVKYGIVKLQFLLKS